MRSPFDDEWQDDFDKTFKRTFTITSILAVFWCLMIICRSRYHYLFRS